MKKTGSFGLAGDTRMRPFLLAVVVALLASVAFSHGARAQSADDQYGEPNPPQGAAAGGPCRASGSTDGLLNAGDSITYPGAFSVSPGASVVLDDMDGSFGTLIDGQNAVLSEAPGGGIRVEVTGAPSNVSGGNGLLNDTVCNSIVASTGVASGAEEKDRGATGVLPETGGMALAYVGVFVVAAGLILLARTRRG